jgi:uroporphyrinogen decarboxylase
MSRMTERENYLRAMEYREPERIPCRISFPTATWSKYRDELYEVIRRHPRIFGRQLGKVNYDDYGIQVRGKPWRDEWGCTWRFPINGLDGQVVDHPLSDWSALKALKAPDPIAMRDWRKVREGVGRAKSRGLLASDGPPHGSMFMRLHYLRGFANLMLDFATEHPSLPDLIATVRDYNIGFVKGLVECGVDMIGFGDDLGNQDRLPIRPEIFRKYLVPAYKDIFREAHEAGVHVHFHSDGHILEVIGDLASAGVTVINPQSRANGIDEIRERCFGKICVDLDVDRQVVLPYGTPEDVRRHIEEVVLKLGSKKGGLWIIAGCYPDTPIRNIEALCEAMEEFQCYYGQ